MTNGAPVLNRQRAPAFVFRNEVEDQEAGRIERSDRRSVELPLWRSKRERTEIALGQTQRPRRRINAAEGSIRAARRQRLQLQPPTAPITRT
jgi:hypothetical protein